jgi:hypothetical protein
MKKKKVPRPKSAPWKNRIKRRAEVAPGEIKLHPGNWRKHSGAQVKAIGAALDEVGWVKEIVVNERTGQLVDGHARVALALARGEKKIPVLYIDVSEQEENIILASLDPLAAMAVPDEEALGKLLGGISCSNEDLALLFASMQDEAAMMQPKEHSAELSDTPPEKRRLGDRTTQVKPVLYVEQVKTLERAIRMTGEPNRGKALMMICDSYLARNEGSAGAALEAGALS